MATDGELLRRYVDSGSDEAFTELVQRHLGLVYRAALRRVGGNAHAADDVTQRVFTDLARKAATLTDRPDVAGWLHTGTRFAASQLVRSEQRRRSHEQEAHTMEQLMSESPPSPAALEPVLDEILDALEERDRTAILLHYFEGQTFAQVGHALSLTADAARMRVNRALDRLRDGLAKKGIASTSAALGASLAGEAWVPKPVPLASTIASRALHHARVASQPAASASHTVAAALAWLGGVVALGIAALGARFLVRDDRAQHPTAGWTSLSDGAGAAPPVAAAPAAPSTPAIDVQPSGAQPPAPGPLGRSTAFDALTAGEQGLLAKLWNGYRRAAPTGHISAVNVGYRAPNFPAIRPLRSAGWVTTRANPLHPLKQLEVRLTPARVDYCETHSAEIEAVAPEP